MPQARRAFMKQFLESSYQRARRNSAGGRRHSMRARLRLIENTITTFNDVR